MAGTPIADAFGEKLTQLIDRAKAEAGGDASATDIQVAGLVAEALGEIAVVAKRLEERINTVSESIPQVAVRSINESLRLG